MPWECLSCGLFNDDQVNDNCEKCGMDKAKAMTMDVIVKKTQCPECGHVHHFGVYCHCFTEAADDSDDDGDDDDDDEEEEDDEDDVLGEKVKERPEATKKKKIKEDNPEDPFVPGEPLPTPNYVKAIKYIRCQCKFGVPASKRYDPPSAKIIFGQIEMKTFQAIERAYLVGDTSKNKKMLSLEEEEALEHFNLKKRQEKLLFVMKEALHFLAPYETNIVPIICKTFKQAADEHEPYIDVRNLVPWNCYRPHYGACDSIYLDRITQGVKVYSGGDKRVLCTNCHTGNLEGLVSRDSGSIARLENKDEELFVASSNGSVRAYVMNHDATRIKLGKTYWDHSKKVNTVLFALPSDGPCVVHGVINHVCYMYTCSEDRYIKVWSMDSHKIVASVTTPDIRNLTIQCMSQSTRHLFCGTSESSIMVFTKFDECERDDVHACSTPGALKAYCMQVSLRLPPKYMPSELLSSVTCVNCCGPNYQFTHLWAGDSTGQMTVWWVPDEGLEFIPARTWKSHEGPINAMQATWKHMISIADDGCIILHELGI